MLRVNWRVFVKGVKGVCDGFQSPFRSELSLINMRLQRNFASNRVIFRLGLGFHLSSLCSDMRAGRLSSYLGHFKKKDEQMKIPSLSLPADKSTSF